MVRFIGNYRLTSTEPLNLPGMVQGEILICEVISSFPSHYLAGWVEHRRIMPIGITTMDRYPVNFNTKREIRLRDQQGFLTYLPFRKMRYSFVAQTVSFWLE